MKVLKSGIEMTPEEMHQVKGGSCACGCAGGFASIEAYYPSYEEGYCSCGCIELEPDPTNPAYTSSANSAAGYPV